MFIVAPIYIINTQYKFLVCENVPGNKPDSDSESVLCVLNEALFRAELAYISNNGRILIFISRGIVHALYSGCLDVFLLISL